jgi:hypothetical protein
MKEEEHKQKHGPSTDRIHPRAVEWLNHEIMYSCSSWGKGDGKLLLSTEVSRL